MKLGGIVVLTSVKVILKFGYDHINISYRNALFKNMSNPSKFGSHKRLKKVTLAKVILKVGYDHINIS